MEGLRAHCLWCAAPLASTRRCHPMGRDVMTRDRQIDYIEFSATDLEATKKFYSQVFGWDFVDYGPNYTSFKDGRLAGGFKKADQPAPAGTLVVIFVEDLAAA